MIQKSIKKNSIYSILKTGSTILFPLITFPYISRILLTENVGKIDFGLSIISFFSLIASLGINTYAIRECSAVRDDRDKLGDIASQLFSINVITTLIAYVALAVILICFRELDNYRTLIIVQSLSIVLTTLGADWLNSAMEDFKYITLRTVALQLISLILMFVFIHEPEDYMKYVIICLISSAGCNVTNIGYRKKYCKIRFIINVKRDIDWKQHIGPIMYLFVMILAQTIFSSVDSTMLGLIQGDYAVGIYSTANKITNIISQVVGSLLWVIMPRMSYYFSEKKYDEINQLLQKVLGFNLLLGLPCLVGCYVMAEDLVVAIAGEAFVEAGSILRILMIGFAFSLVGGSFLGNAILLPSKQEKYYMVVCCITAVVNMVSNYIFIPKYGTKAAAATTVGCSLIILVLLLFKIDKNVKIKNVGKLAMSPIVGCVGIVVVCLLCRKINNLWIRVIVSLATSVMVYVTVQVILKNELVEDSLIVLKQKIVAKVGR